MKKLKPLLIEIADNYKETRVKIEKIIKNPLS
jgi:hypothetical protein